MSEDLTKVSHCVSSINADFFLWWVDDCFTNRTQDGGYLPIEDVKKGLVKPQTHGNSGDIYEMLLNLTQEERIDFCVCSFEYAQANWKTKLNCRNNVVLIDIGYEGQTNADTFGLNLLLEMVQDDLLTASVVFLTVDAQRVTDWIIATGNWLPTMSVPLEKSRIAPSERVAKTPEKEIRALVRSFKQQRLKDFSKC